MKSKEYSCYKPCVSDDCYTAEPESEDDPSNNLTHFEMVLQVIHPLNQGAMLQMHLTRQHVI